MDVNVLKLHIEFERIFGQDLDCLEVVAVNLILLLCIKLNGLEKIILPDSLSCCC
jgi:hypothetical protein